MKPNEVGRKLTSRGGFGLRDKNHPDLSSRNIMLCACLRATDIGKPWKLTPGGWKTARSTIRPFSHPALHTQMFVSRRRTAVIVRERVHGQPQPSGSFALTQCSERELDHALAEARAWPLDFVELLMTRRDGAAEVRLRCGHWGTAPVYLLERNRVLYLDWDVRRLYSHLRTTNLNPGFAAQYLLGLDHPYSRRTIFPDIWMLTERATALWRPPFHRLKITYPPPEERARARRLKPGARVVETFREILSASMRRWLVSEDDLVGVELSGGLDSSIVAATAATIVRSKVRSYGMIMPGTISRYQRARRGEVVRHFGLLDRTLPCIDYPPFNPKSPRVRNLAVVLWSEFYEEAVGSMLSSAFSDGVRLIFTGMGGDELCSYQSGEVDGHPYADELTLDGSVEQEDSMRSSGNSPYPPFTTAVLEEAFEAYDALIDDAPQPLMETSSLESAAAVSTLYLNSGIWPVSPLCSPELVQFCRQLPLNWRHKRIIERKVLKSFGCSRTVAYPNPKHLEDFYGVMDFALRKASSGTITKLFRNSRLADQGLVDRDALIATYDRHRRKSSPYGDQILGAVMLELTLRSVERQMTRRTLTNSES